MTCQQRDKWMSLVVLVLLLFLFFLLLGCGARHYAAHPGSDSQHPALTPVGKVTCRTGLLKLFGSYGPKNCKNTVPPQDDGEARNQSATKVDGAK